MVWPVTLSAELGNLYWYRDLIKIASTPFYGLEVSLTTAESTRRMIPPGRRKNTIHITRCLHALRNYLILDDFLRLLRSRGGKPRSISPKQTNGTSCSNAS